MPLFANNFILEPPGHKLCSTANYVKQMVFVDSQGIFFYEIFNS